MTVRIYPRHVVAAGYCLVPGGKRWIDHHDFDWKSFVKYGIAIEDVEALNDTMGHRVAAQARLEGNK